MRKKVLFLPISSMVLLAVLLVSCGDPAKDSSVLEVDSNNVNQVVISDEGQKDITKSKEFLAVRAEVQACLNDAFGPIDKEINKIWIPFRDGLISEEDFRKDYDVLVAKKEKLSEEIVSRSDREALVKSAMAKGDDELLTFEEVMSLEFACRDISMKQGFMFKEHDEVHNAYEAGLITKEEANEKIEDLRKRGELSAISFPYYLKASPYLDKDIHPRVVKSESKPVSNSSSSRVEKLRSFHKTASPRFVLGKKIP